jgi:hypothetical protein
MRTLIEILAGVAIAANAVIYGSDVFGAIVLRPAIAALDDRTLTQLLGHVHRIADRRFPAIGAVGLVAAAMVALAAASGHWVSAAAGTLATIALIVFLGIYIRISKPVNTALTAAAVADRVPGDARQLQARWDSVIDGRVALQTIALAALCVGLAAASPPTPGVSARSSMSSTALWCKPRAGLKGASGGGHRTSAHRSRLDGSP